MADTIDMFREVPDGHQPVARMRSVDERLSKLAKGHLNIATLIAQGWVILPDPVNRLLPEYRSACLVDMNTNEAQEYEPVKAEPFEPRGKKSKNKYRR